jgi:serralysin
MPSDFELPPSPGGLGTFGKDSFTGGPGNDTIDGGGGTDTITYTIGRSNFSLAVTSTGFTVTDKTGANGADTLLNIERLKFSDGAIALDVGATQSAGETALLLGAVLPGKLVFDASKQGLLGAAIDLFDQGYSLQTLSGAVMRLPIWDVLTGKATPSSTDIATYLLTNVSGVAPDATTLASAVTALNTETDFATQGNFLWHLAESSANQARIDLVGLAFTGLGYGL